MGITTLRQATLILVTVLACSCAKRESSVRKDVRKDVSSGTTIVSIEEVRSLLSAQRSIGQLEAAIGVPMVRSEGNWGNMMYALPNGKYLFFFFKGSFVTAARYDGTEIPGVSPKVHEMKVELQVGADEESLFCALDDESLTSIGDLKKRLQNLPAGSLVEWRQSCTGPTSTDLTNELKQFCSEKGIVLLHYPAG